MTELKTNIEKQMKLFDLYLDRTGMDHKPYQYDGVKWCIENELTKDCPCGIRGGIIADEMGLGKTIIMIGVMVCHFVPRTLIVVPPILLEQWYLQIYRTTGHKALVYHGKNKRTVDVETLKRAIIVITTYGAVSVKKKKKNPEAKEKDFVGTSLLHQVEWSRVVYDEAHHLRNSNTALFHGARLLKGGIHWLVSGTPIQNNIKDFYSLCSILRLPASFYTEKENLALFAKSFLLKRTKRQVGISIAPLTVHKIGVPWSNLCEKDLADQIHSASASDKGSNAPHRLFQMLLARQSCIMNGMMLNHLHTLVEWGLVQKKNVVAMKEAFTKKSKLDHLIGDLLQKKGNGNGKLVFCHFRQEIDEIATRLRAGGMDRVAVIDGRVTKTKKEEALHGAYETLILQIQTGCEGLNLQEKYSEIYFVSPHWNPAVEDQAIARCHRIGQTKPVLVKRFLMESFAQGNEDGAGNSSNIEEYVMAVQDEKRKVASVLME